MFICLLAYIAELIVKSRYQTQGTLFPLPTHHYLSFFSLLLPFYFSIFSFSSILVHLFFLPFITRSGLTKTSWWTRILSEFRYWIWRILSVATVHLHIVCVKKNLRRRNSLHVQYLADRDAILPRWSVYLRLCWRCCCCYGRLTYRLIRTVAGFFYSVWVVGLIIFNNTALELAHTLLYQLPRMTTLLDECNFMYRIICYIVTFYLLRTNSILF